MPFTLEEYLDGVHGNSRHTLDEQPQYVAVLRRVNDAYDAVLEHLGSGREGTAAFAAMSHAAFLASVQLATSGQLPPAFMTMRGCVEDALYGFYLLHHPHLKKLWTNREASEDAKKRVRNEFKLGRMKKFLIGRDAAVGRQLEIVYDATIDLGAHPNALAFFSHLTEVDATKDHEWQYINLLAPDLPFALRMAAMAGLAALNVFKLMFPITFVSTGGSDIVRKIHDLVIALPEIDA